MGLGKELNRKPSGPGRIVPGKCEDLDWEKRIATVNVGGGLIPASIAGPPPRPGDQVWVLQLGDTWLCVGRPALPGTGTVTGPAVDGRWPVLGDDTVTRNMPGPYGATLGENDRVLLNWDAGGHIVMRVSAEVPRNLYELTGPTAPSGIGGGIRSADFIPVDAASWFDGKWTTGDVVQAPGYNGSGWFYGTQIASSIPDDATILSVQVLLIVGLASGVSTGVIGTHVQAARPVGPFDVDNLASVGPAGSGTAEFVLLPAQHGDLLKTGAALGLGTAGAGYRQYKRGSGTLRITWKD